MTTQDSLINSVTYVLSSVADRTTQKSAPNQDAARDHEERPGDQAECRHRPEASTTSAKAKTPYATGGRINLVFLAEVRRRSGRAKLSRMIETLTGPDRRVLRSRP